MRTRIACLRGNENDLTGIEEELGDVEDWQLVVPSETSGYGDDFGRNFWIGFSVESRRWILATTKDKLVPERDALLTLQDAQTADTNYVAEVLLRALAATERDGNLSEDAARAILEEVPLPQYRRASDYLPELPKEWHDLPCELVVAFSLSDGAHVGRDTFKHYQRDTLSDALGVLRNGRHDGILIRYQLQTRGVVPFLFWDSDSPLARRGKDEPRERQKVQKGVPWEVDADPTILELYQHLTSDDPWSAGPPYFGEPTIWLRVGGRTKEEADDNWTRCAKALRQLGAKPVAES
jgi:hypothetical protein